MDVLQRFVVESLSPLLKSVGKVSSLLEDMAHEYVWLRNIRHENEELRDRMAALEQMVTDYREAYVENLRLRRLLDFKTTIEAAPIAAQAGF